MVEKLGIVKFPVIISMDSTFSTYFHVVVIWKGAIIDFEHHQLYPLTVANLHYTCGKGSMFHRIGKGFGILPNKSAKLACGDVSGWGKKELKGTLKFMFGK